MSNRPRRRKKSAAARLRPFWIVIALAALAVGAGGYYAANWQGFYPARVSVSGNRIVPSAQILARAGIAAHRNVWLQNMHAAAARISGIPYVKEVRLERALPANVSIRIRERVPYAQVRYGAQAVTIDSDLRVLQPAGAHSTLPVLVSGSVRTPSPGEFIADPQIARLAADQAALALAHVAVSELRYDRFGDLVATMHGGIHLLLGDDTDLSGKTPLIDPIISQVEAGGRRIAALDLRAPKTPVVVYKEGGRR